MFINVRPVQKEPVKWPWKNKINDQGYPFVVESPGKVEIPDLIEPFDWSNYEYKGTTMLPQFGTKDMKSVFTTYCRFMGTEEALVAMIDNEASEDIMLIADAFYRWNRKLFSSQPQIKYFMIGDDIGFNDGLLVSPDLIREDIIPAWKRLYTLAKSHSVPNLVFHSDGDIVSLLPDLYDMGITHLFYEPVGRMAQIEPYTCKGGMSFFPVDHTDNEPFAGYAPEGDHV